MSQKICYKAVRVELGAWREDDDPDMMLSYSTVYSHCVQYKMNEWIVPKVADTPLFAFARKADAIASCNGVDVLILKCKYSNLFIPRPANQNDLKMMDPSEYESLSEEYLRKMWMGAKELGRANDIWEFRYRTLPGTIYVESVFPFEIVWRGSSIPVDFTGE